MTGSQKRRGYMGGITRFYESCRARYRGYLYFYIFSVKDRNLFYRVDTIGNIFMSGSATSENINDGVHEIK